MPGAFGESRYRDECESSGRPERCRASLVAQTERAELAALDEDAAIDLEARIARARNKYVGQYRRGASARVAERGARGQAAPENQQAALKAEAFEEALARVSRRVAALALETLAAALRAERLAAARAARAARGPGAQEAAPAAGLDQRTAPLDAPRPELRSIPATRRPK